MLQYQALVNKQIYSEDTSDLRTVLNLTSIRGRRVRGLEWSFSKPQYARFDWISVLLGCGTSLLKSGWSMMSWAYNPTNDGERGLGGLCWAVQFCDLTDTDCWNGCSVECRSWMELQHHCVCKMLVHQWFSRTYFSRDTLRCCPELEESGIPSLIKIATGITMIQGAFQVAGKYVSTTDWWLTSQVHSLLPLFFVIHNVQVNILNFQLILRACSAIANKIFCTGTNKVTQGKNGGKADESENIANCHLW